MKKCTLTAFAALSFFMFAADAHAAVQKAMQQYEYARMRDDFGRGGGGGGGGGGTTTTTKTTTSGTTSTTTPSTSTTTTTTTTTSVGASKFLDTPMQTATVSGCPSGTIVSSDGCCCVKE